MYEQKQKYNIINLDFGKKVMELFMSAMLGFLKPLSQVLASFNAMKTQWIFPKTFFQRGKDRNLKSSMAGSRKTEPEAWWRHRSDPPQCHPERYRTVAGSLCPTWGFFWGCCCPSPQRGPLCWAGSRRRRSTCHLWSQLGTQKAWWHPRGSRNLQEVDREVQRHISCLKHTWDLLAVVALSLAEKKDKINVE